MIQRKHGYLAHRDNDDSNPIAGQLERDGFAVVPGVFSAAEIDALRTDIDRVFDEYPADQRAERPPEAEAMFRYEMLNRSAVCQAAIAHRGILDVIEPLIGDDCHVIANTAWRNPANTSANHGGEAWHIDAGPHIPLAHGTQWPVNIPHPVFAIGVHIYLTACGINDGPTGVIPGSHLSGQTPPPDRLFDDNLRWNNTGVKPLLAESGDVGFFVSDVWHRRMRTQPGDRGRFFLQAHYGRRDIAQRLHTTEQSNQLSHDAISRANSEREKSLIGLHKPFFYDG